MQNRELKKRLIENGTFQKYREESYRLYEDFHDYEKKDEELKKIFGSENEKALKQLLNCRKKQRQKVERQLDFYFNTKDYEVYFITFTFSEIDGTEASRRKKVIRALQNFDDFSLNIDYGEEGEREHYHAICYIRKNRLPWEFKIIGKEKHKTKKGKFITVLKTDDIYFQNYEEGTGFITVQEVKHKDNRAVARYLSKITLHSIKVKQKYISTRKGSHYQKWKTQFDKYMKLTKWTNFSSMEKGELFPLVFPNERKDYLEFMEFYNRTHLKPDAEDDFYSNFLQD